MPEVKKLILGLLLLAAAVVVFGCADVRDDEISKPWAQPEPWERNMGFGPFTPQ